jgi:hypothetical protein
MASTDADRVSTIYQDYLHGRVTFEYLIAASERAIERRESARRPDASPREQGPSGH